MYETTQNFAEYNQPAVQQAQSIPAVQTVQPMQPKKYELRELQSKDVFPMFRIISKIGLNEFKACFESPDVKNAVLTMMQDDNASNGNQIAASVGIGVALEVANVIVTNVPKCEQDIYLFLSQISGKQPEEIAEMSMVTFFEMIIDVVKKDEFRDFIGVVSKLFK